MPRRKKNITVTLDETTARWARVEAAKQDVSLSSFLGDLLRRERVAASDYRAAMRRFLAVEPGRHRGPGETLPTRDELHER